MRAVRSPDRANLALAALFLGMFVMGSTELLIVGVLDLVAADLRISLPAAGTLVTAYALGLAIGGPVLTALTIRLNKRTVLAAMLVLFIATTLVAVLTSSYALMLVARTGTGAFQGVFIAAAFATGTAVVPAERMGRAIAVVMSGVTVSGVFGVPLGTLAGQVLGWRGSFTAATVLAALALVATLMLVPAVPSAGGGVGRQARHAFAPPVLAILALTVLVFASVYAALTYIVPFLHTVTGISGAGASIFLLAYGVATAAGSFAGGRFADVDAARTLVVASIGVAVSLLVLSVTGSIAALVAVALLGTGLFAMGMAPSLQYRVISLAGPGSAFAQSLPASAANVGIALGSYAGGVAFGAFDVSAAVVAGVLIAVVAIPVAWAAGFLKPPATADPAVAPDMCSEPA
jgi:MFS transporter, DHA1 family, inner membrane transport protein